MKSVEERLRELPAMAQTLDLQADDALKFRILQAAQEKEAPRRSFSWRMVPALCALAVLVGVMTFAVPGALNNKNQPLVMSQAAGNMDMLAEGGVLQALDVPSGSVTIKKSNNPSYRSIWASGQSGNFPLIGVKGRYYRLLTNPTSISDSLLGDSLGTVDNYTSEPALAGKSGICSNVVHDGEKVYAVKGMSGAAVAAKVDGKWRVFQRVSFADNARVGSESLSDTLKAGSVVALELSGKGTINDKNTAKQLISILTSNATFLRAGGGETNQSLLIQLSNGITLQMAVNGERLIACGTWACPEFFEAFDEALQ